MTDLELRECPFCGEMPSTSVCVTKWNGYTAEIQCSVKCRCGISKDKSLNICNTEFSKIIQAMELVAIDWNRRKEDDNG